MRIDVDRPSRKSMHRPHVIVSATLLYAAFALTATCASVIGLITPTPFVLLVGYIVCLLLIFVAWKLAGGDKMLISWEHSETVRFVRYLTDSVGLSALNAITAAVAVVGILLALKYNPILCMLFLPVLVVAVLGSDYRAAPLREKEDLIPPDLDEFTLPMYPSAKVDTLFQWMFRALSPLSDGKKEIALEKIFYLAEPRYARACGLSHDIPEPMFYGSFLASDANPEIIAIAAAVDNAVKSAVKDITAFQLKCNVLGFVNQFRLVTELDSKGRKDYLRLPTEVLWEFEGTKACLVVLSAAILRVLGYDHALVWIEDVTGSGRIALMLPGFDCIGKESDFYFDPSTGSYCAICEPVLKRPELAASTDSPTNAWDWYIGPLTDADRVAMKKRIVVYVK